jgi:hypothetical protein
MSQLYHVISRADSRGALGSQQLAEVPAKDGQLLLPLFDIIEHARGAVDELIDIMAALPSRPSC